MAQKIHPSVFFNEAHAASYDERFSGLAPLRATLDRLVEALLYNLPEKARILCVGAGTGAEILYLGEKFPGWHFTAVEPSAPMLAICRQRVEERGLSARCEFHEGFLETLPLGKPFDAATCILVSQFILDREERVGLFADIARRLRSGGQLISADLSADLAAPASQTVLEAWLRMMKGGGANPEDVEAYRQAYGRDVAVIAAAEVEGIIQAGGFEPPTRFFQAGLIHAWHSKV